MKKTEAKKPVAKPAAKSVAKVAKPVAKSVAKVAKPVAKSVAKVAKPVAKPAASEAPESQAALVEIDAPHIECRLVVGDLAVQVDPSSLEHTLGAGVYGHGLGLVDAWPDAAWVGLLAHLKLPADPLDRLVAEQPVKRLVQRLWYEAIKGGVPEERRVAFEARDTEHAKEYKEEFEGVKSGAEGRKERAVKSFGRKGETVYTPTVLLKDKKLALGGQQAPLLEFFRDTKFASATTQQATDGMVAHGLKTGTKPERIAAFYLCQWVKKQFLMRGTATE
jgi:hypothetical protein